MDEVRILRPSYPGDTIRASSEVLETRPSTSKPGTRNSLSADLGDEPTRRSGHPAQTGDHGVVPWPRGGPSGDGLTHGRHPAVVNWYGRARPEPNVIAPAVDGRSRPGGLRSRDATAGILISDRQDRQPVCGETLGRAPWPGLALGRSQRSAAFGRSFPADVQGIHVSVVTGGEGADRAVSHRPQTVLPHDLTHGVREPMDDRASFPRTFSALREAEALIDDALGDSSPRSATLVPLKDGCPRRPTQHSRKRLPA